MSNVRNWYHTHVTLILESILIGFITGLVIAGFRYILSKTDMLRGQLYKTLVKSEVSVNWLILWVIVLVMAGFFLGWAGKVRPMIKGGGIPQIKSPQFRSRPFDWLIDLPLKFFMTVLGLSTGLSLGKCGPAVQIGAYIGKGVHSIFPRPGDSERDALISSAAAAGFAAVFNTPMSGILFAIEEFRIPLSPMFLVCIMSASTAADLTAAYYLKSSPLFDFTHISALPVQLIPWIILLGVASAFVGDIFKRSLYLSINLYDRFHIPPLFRPFIPLVVSVPLGLFVFDITGGGYELIVSLTRTDRTLIGICFLLIGKILFTALSVGSGIAGGIFFPILACGALAGNCLGKLLWTFEMITNEQVLSFVVLGIAAFFTSVMKSPLTAMILILEMSGTVNHLGTLVPVCLTSFIVSELIGSRSINEVLLERMLRQNSNPQS
jgi:H+/Cl- antiporter ClcA